MTDILSFFGTQAPLFVVTELSGDNIKRFVNREKLLNRFVAYIQNRQNCAIIGEQGSGKSSFLLKLLDLIKEDYHADYIQFSLPLQHLEKVNLRFLQRILRSIIYIVSKNKKLVQLNEKAGIDIAFEMDRLEYSITVENHLTGQNSINGEMSLISNKLLSLMVPADFKAKLNAKRMEEEKDITKREYFIHNEETIHLSIEKITQAIDQPIVLFIDELDKAGRYPLDTPEWEKEVMKILELSRKLMLNYNMILVFSLQNELYEKLNKATKNQEDVSILRLVNAHKKLPLFDLPMALDAVDQSLAYAQYPAGRDDLFEPGLIALALKLTSGNPRLLMIYLLESVTNAYLNHQKQVSLDCLKDYIFDLYEDMTEDHWNAML
jgi:energy-coupling factor transporter ATP-binding protein EcfA2